MTTTTPAVAASPRDTMLLNIGRMWDNNATAQGKEPRLRLAIDRELGLSITLPPGSQLLAFPNNKREGEIGANDPDYRIAVELPTAIAQAEIERQKVARAETAPAAA